MIAPPPGWIARPMSWDNWSPLMKERLTWALGAYAVLLLLAVFTLQGPFRLAVCIFLAGLVVKTWIASQRG